MLPRVIKRANRRAALRRRRRRREGTSEDGEAEDQDIGGGDDVAATATRSEQGGGTGSIGNGGDGDGNAGAKAEAGGATEADEAEEGVEGSGDSDSDGLGEDVPATIRGPGGGTGRRVAVGWTSMVGILASECAVLSNEWNEAGLSCRAHCMPQCAKTSTELAAAFGPLPPLPQYVKG